MLSVAIAFGLIILLGFGLAPLFSTARDWLFGSILALLLVAVAGGVMRVFGYPFWPAKIRAKGPAMRPDPDMDPNKDWSSDGAGSRTGYEMSFEDFRRLVSDPASQPIIAPLVKEWYGFDIKGQGSETVVRSEEGHVVGLRNLHNLIQVDPPRQHIIYDRAMDLWR